MTNIVSQISVHQQHELLARLEAAGLTGDLSQKVIESRGNALAKDVVGLIRGSQLPFPSYPVTVNYGLTVEQLIKAGKYDWVNNNITSGHFPSSEKGRVEVFVYPVNFNRNISSEDAIKELDRQGLRPTTLKELLALGVAQPDLQRSNPIVALGSTWRDSRGFLLGPYLGSCGGSRYLYLVDLGGGWPPGWRFAAVRK